MDEVVYVGQAYTSVFRAGILLLSNQNRKIWVRIDTFPVATHPHKVIDLSHALPAQRSFPFETLLLNIQVSQVIQSKEHLLLILSCTCFDQLDCPAHCTVSAHMRFLKDTIIKEPFASPKVCQSSEQPWV